MRLDDLFVRYFGSDDLDSVSPDALQAGAERLRVEFGLETDRGRRFGMWALMQMLGVAPDLDVAFKDAADRDAARTLMELSERAEE
ncbi:hypothetical protein AWL63_08740 [Sphingomonas panacis]|uniref:Uncharacterized protein n=1 Tax=Sphingomonas panacis TaxID=1560345 RepID=A0A1B3Z9C5_9SPHN|nr:hypothetical protein [Sphingomonas panacis]AOH84041.1 hypothetical protein AWL63_08740 [Sphingomonas panacis]